MYGGKCPKCEKNLTRVNGKYLEVWIGIDRKLRGLSFTCPHCDSIVSVQVDPIALKTDTINGVVDKLKGRAF